MLKIKLAPRGKKHQITYRIVIAEARSKNNGDVIADIGFYTPQIKKLEIDREKLADWQKKGAQITLGVDKLLNPEKYPAKPKFKKEKPVEAESEAKAETTEETIVNETEAKTETPAEEATSTEA